MDKNYIFNLETTKIELHFDKAEYDALTDAQKKSIKSNFLWSNKNKCWVSRAKEPNLVWAINVAKELGFNTEQRIGERLSFGETLERKQERAEDRAERYEEYADNAQRKGKELQRAINDKHGDIAFFTQPIIAGHAGSQAFARQRQKLFDRYDKGFEEYRKSDYFSSRADTARQTASGKQYNDIAFLDRRIKEAKKEIRNREKNIMEYEKQLNRLENGETLKGYDGVEITVEMTTERMNREFELISVAIDKQAWLQNRIDELGGIKYSPDDIQVGMIVKIKGYDDCEIITKGKVNVTYKTKFGSCLTAAYAEITDIVNSEAKKPKVHPFKVGDVFRCHEWNDVERKALAHTYTVVKAMDKLITLQDENGNNRNRKPIEAKFTSEPMWVVKITSWNDGMVYKKDEG